VLPLPLSSLRSTLPVFPANKHLAVSLTAEQFRYSFGNAIEVGESDSLYQRWSIPAPGRPLFEAAAANFSLHSPAKVNTTIDDRGPLLLIMGGQDHTVPPLARGQRPDRVPRPRALADHRSRLARRRQRMPGLAR
jgi:hypothetical protein